MECSNPIRLPQIPHVRLRYFRRCGQVLILFSLVVQYQFHRRFLHRYHRIYGFPQRFPSTRLGISCSSWSVPERSNILRFLVTPYRRFAERSRNRPVRNQLDQS